MSITATKSCSNLELFASIFHQSSILLVLLPADHLVRLFNNIWSWLSVHFYTFALLLLMSFIFRKFLWPRAMRSVKSVLVAQYFNIFLSKMALIKLNNQCIQIREVKVSETADCYLNVCVNSLLFSYSLFFFLFNIRFRY